MRRPASRPPGTAARRAEGALDAKVGIGERDRVAAEASRRAAERGRADAETARVAAETLRGLAEAARTSAEDARKSAEEARRHRDFIVQQLESFRAKAEFLRKTAEQLRRARTEQFDTDVRRAIREEVEVAHEIQRSADDLAVRRRGAAGRKPARPTRRRRS